MFLILDIRATKASKFQVTSYVKKHVFWTDAKMCNTIFMNVVYGIKTLSNRFEGYNFFHTRGQPLTVI